MYKDKKNRRKTMTSKYYNETEINFKVNLPLEFASRLKQAVSRFKSRTINVGVATAVVVAGLWQWLKVA